MCERESETGENRARKEGCVFYMETKTGTESDGIKQESDNDGGGICGQKQ